MRHKSRSTAILCGSIFVLALLTTPETQAACDEPLTFSAKPDDGAVRFALSVDEPLVASLAHTNPVAASWLLQQIPASRLAGLLDMRGGTVPFVALPTVAAIEHQLLYKGEPSPAKELYTEFPEYTAALLHYAFVPAESGAMKLRLWTETVHTITARPSTPEHPITEVAPLFVPVDVLLSSAPTATIEKSGEALQIRRLESWQAMPQWTSESHVQQSPAF